MTSPLTKAFKLIEADLTDDELLEQVEKLQEEATGHHAMMFDAVYEAMIVAGRHPDYPAS